MFLLIIIQHLIIFTNSETQIPKTLISEGTKPFMLGYTEDTNMNYYLIFSKDSNTYRYIYSPDLTYTEDIPFPFTYNENANFKAFSYFGKDFIIGNSPSYTLSVSSTSTSSIITQIESITRISLALFSSTNYMITGGYSNSLYIYSTGYKYYDHNYYVLPQGNAKNHANLSNESHQSVISTNIENWFIFFFYPYSQNSDHSKVLYGDNVIGTYPESQPWVDPVSLGSWTSNSRRIDTIHLKTDLSVILYCVLYYNADIYVCNFGIVSSYSFQTSESNRLTVLSGCYESSEGKYFSLILIRNFYVAAICSDNYQNLYINFVTYSESDSNISIGTQRKIYIGDAITFPSYGEFNIGGSIFFQLGDSIYRVDIDINSCNNGEFNNIESRAITTINFDDYIYNGNSLIPKYNITSIDNNIIIYKSSTIITVNSETYSYSDTYSFSFKAIYSLTPLEITFKLVENGETSCTIKINTIQNCCDGCLNCEQNEDSTYECKACDNDDSYYQIKDATNIICYTTSTIISEGKYYLNTTNNYFDTCMISCKTCSSDSLCDECDNDLEYYKNENNTDSIECILKGTEGYYFKDDKIYTCPSKCETCVYEDDIIKCLTCASDYYKVIDSNPIECIQKDNNDNYYISGEKEVTRCPNMCLTCENNIQCNSCNVDYDYYIDDSETNIKCLIKSTLGYYCDEINKKLIKCTDTNCNKCDSNDKCLECKTDIGYYLVSGMDDGICVNKDTPGYTFNEEEGILYFTCDINICESCSDEGCMLCKTNYYPAYSSTNSPPYDCREKNDPVIGQYWDGSSFKLCNTGYTTLNDYTECDSCNEDLGYYQVKGITNFECHKETDIGYFKASDGDIYKCDISCISCDTTSTNCNECNNDGGYYLKYGENLPGLCYISTLNGYYLNGDYLMKCYESCGTCNYGGNITQHNCTSCLNENYISSPEITNNCDIICSNYYFYDSNNVRYCVDHCPYGCYLIVNKNKCVNECPSEYYIVENKKECVNDNCPLNYYLIENSKICVNSCSSMYYLAKTLRQCLVDCSSQNLKTYLSTCVEECPDNYIYNSLTNKCVVNNNKECKIIESDIYIKTSTLSNNIDNLISEYVSLYSLLNNIVLLRTHTNSEYILVIYKNEECLKEIKDKISLTSISETCLLKLKENYSYLYEKDEKIIFIILKAQIYNTTTNEIISQPIAIYSKTGLRLDLSICTGEKYTEYVKITEENGGNINLAREMSSKGIDIYNISDPFFNDVCFGFTDDDGNDVSLKERVEFYYQDVNLCEENCEYKGIIYNDDGTGEAECECEIKNSFLTEALDNAITGEIFELIASANFDLFKCYKNVFNMKNWGKNYGGWIIFTLGIIQIALIGVYLKENLTIMLSYLERRISTNKPKDTYDDDKTIVNSNSNKSNLENENSSYKNSSPMRKKSSDLEINLSNPPKHFFHSNNELNENISEENNKNEDLNKNKKKESKEYIYNKRKTDNSKNLKFFRKNKKSLALKDKTKDKIFSDSRSINSKAQLDTKRSISSSYKKSLESNLRIYNSQKNLFQNSNNEKGEFNMELNDNVKYKVIKKIKLPDRKIIKEEEKEDEFTEEELNEMPIEEFIQYDKRTFCQFLWSQLVKKQDIINLFFDKHYLMSFHIRCILYLYGVTLYFFVNALFFIESYISTEIHSKGKSFNFIELIVNEIQRCIYSIIVNVIINVIGGAFEENEKRLILLINTEKYQTIYIREVLAIMKNLKMQIRFFLVFNIICLFLFWYYVSSFCNVMMGSRRNWLEGSLITYSITELIPVFICLLCTCLRFLGWKCRCGGGIIYKLSQFLL